MRTAYRTLAWIIAGLVMLQAASEAWFASGVGKFLAEGGTLDLTATSGPLPFIAVIGFLIHEINGMYVIPVTAAVLLVVGYLTHNRKALSLAALIAVLVGIQVTLGLNASSFTFLAFLHGMNALLIFGTAIAAALTFRARQATEVPTPDSAGTPDPDRATRKRRPIVGSGV